MSSLSRKKAERMRWTYSEKVLGAGLSAPALALLRVIAFLYDEDLGYCPLTTDAVLSKLTGFAARCTFTNARRQLLEAGILRFERERKASDRKHGKYGKSNGYVYHLATGNARGLALTLSPEA